MPDLCWIDRIKDVKPRKARLLAECEGENLRAKTGSAHAEKEDVTKSATLDLSAKLFQLADIRQLLLGDIEPSQPRRFVFARPECLIVIPKTLYFVAGLPVAKVFFYRTFQIGGQRGGLSVRLRPTTLAVLLNCVK